jgi:hypothetical protein
MDGPNDHVLCPAMQLPDMVGNVLQHLQDDASSLRAAILVSRMWFACGVDLLWSSPRSEALACVAPCRRQYYADKITALLGDVPEEILADGLRLPRLRRLHLWSREGLVSKEEEEEELEFTRQWRLIEPSLEELQCDLTSVALQHLAARPIQRLRVLGVHNYCRRREWASLESFIDWISSRPTLPLATLHINNIPYSDLAVLDRAFCHFAHRSQLRTLRLSGRSPILQLATVLKARSGFDNTADRNARRPFEQLQSLEIAVASEAVPALVGMLLSITELALSATGTHPVLPAVATLGKLCSLKVELPSWDGSHCRIIPIQSLVQLRKLSLCGRDAYSDFSSDLIEVFGSLSLLEEVEVWPTPPAFPELLMQIGRACPTLRTLLFISVVSLDAVVESSRDCPVFPQLQTLTVKRLETHCNFVNG